MARYSLIPHPETPAKGVTSIAVQTSVGQERPTDFWLEFCIAHDGSLLLPPMLEPERADELWKTTCCEVFVMPDGGGDYIEFNLSPSFRWAAYGFEGYRAGMRNVDLAFDPEIESTPNTPGWYWLAAELDLSMLKTLDAKIGLSVVIEETDGTKSYWALAHAPGPPDFHNPDCFIAKLPAPDAP
ncbi:MAG: DOMON-like domain-containing protein [Sphingomonas sp.]|nr:DOMON-like domain-containing protein [Sphingomonas sp.]